MENGPGQSNYLHQKGKVSCRQIHQRATPHRPLPKIKFRVLIVMCNRWQDIVELLVELRL